MLIQLPQRFTVPIRMQEVGDAASPEELKGSLSAHSGHRVRSPKTSKLRASPDQRCWGTGLREDSGVRPSVFALIHLLFFVRKVAAPFLTEPCFCGRVPGSHSGAATQLSQAIYLVKEGCKRPFSVI